MGCVTKVHLAYIAFGYFDLCFKKPIIINLNDCYERLYSHLSVDHYSGFQVLEGFIGGNIMTLAKLLQGGIIYRKGEGWKAGAIQYFVLYQLILFPDGFHLNPGQEGGMLLGWGFFLVFFFFFLVTVEC